MFCRADAFRAGHSREGHLPSDHVAGEASSGSQVRGTDAGAEVLAAQSADYHDAQTGTAGPDGTQVDCMHQERSAQADSEDAGRSGEDADISSAAHRKRPLKGGLKNVMRTAHKGYQIHRSVSGDTRSGYEQTEHPLYRRLLGET